MEHWLLHITVLYVIQNDVSSATMDQTPWHVVNFNANWLAHATMRGSLRGVGYQWLQTVVDTYGCAPS